jgi:hypothetical protein
LPLLSPAASGVPFGLNATVVTASDGPRVAISWWLATLKSWTTCLPLVAFHKTAEVRSSLVATSALLGLNAISAALTCSARPERRKLRVWQSGRRAQPLHGEPAAGGLVFGQPHGSHAIPAQLA